MSAAALAVTAALALAPGGDGERAAGAAGALPALEVTDVESGAPAVLAPGAKLLHVVAFATWCVPCRDELTPLAEWEARFAGGGYRLAIVAVSRRQSRDRLLRLLAEGRPPGRLYLDGAGRVERALDFDGLPTHILVDADGRVRLRAGSLAELDVAAVEALLHEREAASGAAE